MILDLLVLGLLRLRWRVGRWVLFIYWRRFETSGTTTVVSKAPPGLG